MKEFNGKVLFLDRSDINTDEIIPARYLTCSNREELRSHLLEDLELAGFDRDRDLQGIAAIISKNNFGCGSSREHAPWALELNGITVVIAQGFARIFNTNMFNCGLLAITLPATDIDRLFATFAGRETSLATDLAARQLAFSGDGKTIHLDFTISKFQHALVEAGGWLNLAESRY